jgi:hypothetical protein
VHKIVITDDSNREIKHQIAQHFVQFARGGESQISPRTFLSKSWHTDEQRNGSWAAYASFSRDSKSFFRTSYISHHCAPDLYLVQAHSRLSPLPVFFTQMSIDSSDSLTGNIHRHSNQRSLKVHVHRHRESALTQRPYPPPPRIKSPSILLSAVIGNERSLKWHIHRHWESKLTQRSLS